MITFYVRKESSIATECDRWHTVFSNIPGLPTEETALLSYKVMCLLDRRCSMNWQPSSRVNFLFCVFFCSFRTAVFYLYVPTKMGFRKNTHQHPRFCNMKPRFWNMEIKYINKRPNKKITHTKRSLLLLTLLSPKYIKNHYIPQIYHTLLVIGHHIWMPHLTAMGKVLLPQNCFKSLEGFAVDNISHSILIYIALETESIEEIDSWVFYAPHVSIYTHTHRLQYKTKWAAAFLWMELVLCYRKMYLQTQELRIQCLHTLLNIQVNG